MKYKLTSGASIVRTADGACIPPDPANRDYADYLAWLAEGNTPAPVDAPTPEQVQAATVADIQGLLDSTAQAHGFDSIVSAISYAGSSIPKWDAEGTRARAWRDEVWYAAYLIQEAVIAGTRPLPTVAEVLAEMPPANWPQ